MKEYEEIVRKKGLPRVGQTIRSKKYGTLWRVLEKKEVWQNIRPGPQDRGTAHGAGHLSVVLAGHRRGAAGSRENDGL